MSVAEVVAKRRSVRKFLSRPIPREDLRECLEVARLAPSACNSQPWTFVVADEPELKDRICDKAFAGIYSMNKFVKEAPVIVAVVSEKGKFMSAFGGQIRNTRYHLIDIGIACEHFILRAEELGIGSCWIGWFDEKPVKELLEIPRNRKVEVIIALGYSGSSESRLRVRKSLEEMSSFNRYGGR